MSKEWESEAYQIRRELAKFLQSGCRRNAFVKRYANCGKGERKKSDEIKLGAPKAPDSNGNIKLGKNVMQQDAEWIDEYMNRYHYKPDGLSKRETYNKLIEEKYSYKIKGKPNIVNDEVNRITYDQFLYHANKMKTTDKILKQLGQLKYDLNERMLYSNATLEADGAGKRFLIDSTIADVWLVDKYDRNRVIGRPVVYIITDEFSRLIVGMSVGLEGPSWNGACAALLNMIENKVEYVKKHCNRDIREVEWPSHHIPEIILADRGEMEGKCPERLVTALNIDLETTPPFRGDLKGIVERKFGMINGHIKYKTPGAVKKEFNARVDKDPRLTAELDIDEIRNIIIHRIIYYNNKEVSEYPASKSQIHKGIPSIPSILWRWSVQNLRGAVRTVDLETFKMALLRESKGTLSREGLRLMGAYYWNKKKDIHIESWILAKNKKRQIMKNKFVVYYDSRDLNTIYLPHRDDKGYDILKLMEKSKKYEDMCEGEIMFFNKLDRENNREEEQQQQQNAIDTNFWEDEILKEAKRKKKAAAPNKPKTKTGQIGNVKQNRAEAKVKEEEANVIRLGEEKINEEILGEIVDKELENDKEEEYIGESIFDEL